MNASLFPVESPPNLSRGIRSIPECCSYHLWEMSANIIGCCRIAKLQPHSRCKYAENTWNEVGEWSGWQTMFSKTTPIISSPHSWGWEKFSTFKGDNNIFLHHLIHSNRVLGLSLFQTKRKRQKVNSFQFVPSAKCDSCVLHIPWADLHRFLKNIYPECGELVSTKGMWRTDYRCEDGNLSISPVTLHRNLA
jgi:hypothetical protein